MRWLRLPDRRNPPSAGRCRPARGQPGYAIPQPVNPALESQPIPGPGQEESGGAGQQDSAPEQDRAADLLPAIKGIEAAIRGLIADEDEIARQRQEDREVSDLNAQQDMALWAMWMFFATLAAVGLTAVGVVLIRATLLETRVAAKAAIDTVKEGQRAADAAIEANTIHRDMSIRDQRAWVSFDPELVSGITWDGVSGNITLDLVIKNYGKSVASYVHIYSMMCDMKKTTEAIEQIERDTKRHRDPHVLDEYFTLFPTQGLRTTTPFRFEKPTGPTIRLIGSVVYELAFEGERRQTKFCMSIGAKNGWRLDMSRDIPKDELRFYTPLEPTLIAE